MKKGNIVPETREQAMSVRSHSAVVPPVSALILDAYHIAGVELARIKQKQCLQNEPMSLPETVALKNLMDIIRNGQRMEQESERQSRIRELTDEQLEQRLRDCASALAAAD
ncbi:MAG: hypothetical protein GWN58_58630 [Anaerolineae bacterium]|nr:hypothetical protein [Anaerolineae bacterium]